MTKWNVTIERKATFYVNDKETYSVEAATQQEAEAIALALAKDDHLPNCCDYKDSDLEATCIEAEEEGGIITSLPITENEKSLWRWLGKAASKEHIRPHIKPIHVHNGRAQATNGTILFFCEIAGVADGTYDMRGNATKALAPYPDTSRIISAHDSPWLDVKITKSNNTIIQLCGKASIRQLYLQMLCGDLLDDWEVSFCNEDPTHSPIMFRHKATTQRGVIMPMRYYWSKKP